MKKKPDFLERDYIVVYTPRRIRGSENDTSICAPLFAPKMTPVRRVFLGMADRFDDVTVTKFPIERNGFFPTKNIFLCVSCFSVDMDAALGGSIIPGQIIDGH